MAAATVVAGSRRVAIMGSKRAVFVKVNIANNGDTYADNAIKLLQGVSIDSSTTSAVGGTISGNTITFASAGAITNILLILFGY